MVTYLEADVSSLVTEPLLIYVMMAVGEKRSTAKIRINDNCETGCLVHVKVVVASCLILLSVIIISIDGDDRHGHVLNSDL